MAQTGDYLCFGKLHVQGDVVWGTPSAANVIPWTCAARITMHAWCVGINCSGVTWRLDLENGLTWDTADRYVNRHNDPDYAISGTYTAEWNTSSDRNIPAKTVMKASTYMALGCCDCENPADPYDLDQPIYTGEPGTPTEQNSSNRVSTVANNATSSASLPSSSDCYRVIQRQLIVSGSFDMTVSEVDPLYKDVTPLSYALALSRSKKNDDAHRAAADEVSREALAFAEGLKGGDWRCGVSPSSSTQGRVFISGR